MHPIFTIAKFEISKKKVSARPAVIISLLVVLFLFIGSFFLLTHLGYRQVHKFYQITPSGGTLDSVISASPSIALNPNGEVASFTRSDGSYFFSFENRFQGIAALTALTEWVKSDAQNKIIDSGISPTFLVLLNITSRAREEILQGNPLSRNKTVDISLGEKITQTNSESVVKTLAIENAPNPVPSDGTQLVTQQITRSTSTDDVRTPVNSQADVLAQNISPLKKVPEGLTYPSDINTMRVVTDIFIIIELMLVFNFFSALLGNSFFEEKLNYRSSMLFSLPLRRRYMIIGKLLPYLIMSFCVAIFLLAMQYPHTLAFVSTYALLFVLALVYFSLSFLNGLLARSNKEYSFLNVFTTSILSLYLLIPAFIANYSALGYASLLTPILFLAQKQALSIQLVIFLITIYSALAIAVFTMGSALWNFEYLYKFDSPFEKIRYIIRINTTKAWQFVVYGVCCVPFLWLVQIIMIALFLIVPFQNRLFLLLLGAALSEEFVRNTIMAVHARHKRTSPVNVVESLSLWKRAMCVGIGFGVAEKIILFAAIAPYLEGYQFIVTAGVILPIILHTGFTYIFGKLVTDLDIAANHPWAINCILGFIHASFNYAIITWLGALTFI